MLSERHNRGPTRGEGTTERNRKGMKRCIKVQHMSPPNGACHKFTYECIFTELCRRRATGIGDERVAVVTESGCIRTRDEQRCSSDQGGTHSGNAIAVQSARGPNGGTIAVRNRRPRHETEYIQNAASLEEC